MYKPHPFGCHKGAPHLFPHFNSRLITNQTFFYIATPHKLLKYPQRYLPKFHPINTLHWLIGLKCRQLNSTSSTTTSLRTNFSLADRSKVSKFNPYSRPTLSSLLHNLLSLLHHFCFHFRSLLLNLISINRFDLTPLHFTSTLILLRLQHYCHSPSNITPHLIPTCQLYPTSIILHSYTTYHLSHSIPLTLILTIIQL